MKFQEYFQPSTHYFWQPEEEEGTTIFSLPGGNTIAYGKFLMRIVEDLAPQGLPPLGALLLALIATNHSHEDPLQKVEDIIRGTILRFRKEELSIYENTLDEAIDFLRTVAALPLKYTSGDQRIQLFQILFAKCHRQVSVDDSRNLLLQAEEWVDVRGRFKEMRVEGEITRSKFLRDFKCIGLLARQFPNEAAIIEKLTAIPAIPETLQLEEERERAPAEFVDSLIEHHSTFPIGILIRSIWSGLNIPIHHKIPGEQPLGGFSDLTNKGDFDKLLISEFANDDWLLLSRLANNEALFLHREIPPGADDLQRILLLDISLKSWGTPKVLAYAILLAIARHPRTDIHCTAFAVGDGYYPIAFDTVDDLIGSLQVLDGCLHPAEGLIKFFEKQPAKKKLEVIFIAPPETLAHPAVKKVVSDHYAAFKYWITVDREGEICLYKNQNNSRRLVQEIRLPLEQLWNENKWVHPANAGRDGDKGKMVPRPAYAPVLYPPSLPIKAHMTPPDGEIYYVDKVGKVFRLYRDANLTVIRGWELIFEGLPGNITHFEMGEDRASYCLLLCFNAGSRKLTLYSLYTGEARAIRLNGWNGSVRGNFFFHEGAFYFEGTSGYWTIVDDQVVAVRQEDRPEQETFAEISKRSQLRREGAAGRSRYNHSILRNLSRVALTEEGNLLFNKHELVCRPSGHIVLDLANYPATGNMLAHAQWDTSDGSFVFPGGIRVRIDRSGMLTLEWLQGKVPGWDVHLLSGGPTKLNVVKTMKDHLSMGLKEAKTIVDGGGIIDRRMELEAAEILKGAVSAAGATVQIRESITKIYIPAALGTSLGIATENEFSGNDFYYPAMAERPLMKIEPQTFFRQNILPFINHIMGYAAKHKTSS
ncbi:ribosomal protein L7/L12 [Puia dinghuensis]|uniref:Uncharacterized protein n=1 Tax=Puia dinghuensis TaxID=1792502 RepID=A0A8J2U9V3_9BACT|nr:ribosomal protein L7/L12 [Puia dinghuensis]GGA89047.1 hypothetical protein GCM10011511_10380 [Puia dinghuensis]